MAVTLFDEIDELLVTSADKLKDLKQEISVELDKDVARLIERLKAEEKKEYRVIFGNGTWLLIDSNGQHMLHDDRAGDILEKLDELDTFAQENGFCLSDYQTSGYKGKETFRGKTT